MEAPLSTRMYIDKFIKPVDNGIELDNYLNRYPQQPHQRVDDHLLDNDMSSSRSSAFLQYGVAPR